jgi:hypothetical protein
MSTVTERPVRDEQVTCSCGQELDCCTRDHCPRCGRDLHHA